jgi:hypothetical protein
MRGTQIIVSADPKGKYVEGIISGTPKPGTMMEVLAGTAPQGGRFTYQVFQPGTNGQRRTIYILLDDPLQGFVPGVAYVSGSRGFMYVPEEGDEMNILLKDIAGTGDVHSMGETVIAETGSGKFIATTGSPQSEPFRLMETIPAPMADTLAWAVCTGH